MGTTEPQELVRKQLEHVALNDWEATARQILEDNQLFHSEYLTAYKILVRNTELVNDDEYWGSTTSDIFFLTVSLIRMAERNMKQYDRYAEFFLNTLEAVGDENGGAS